MLKSTEREISIVHNKMMKISTCHAFKPLDIVFSMLIGAKLLTFKHL